MTDIVARHDQILPLVIPPANDDVGMRMPGVEVVDGHPVEPGIQIALHLGQKIANERLEVGKARSFVSRDDEAELVRVLLRPIQEGGAIDVITGRVVKAARRALAGHPVADDVLEMRPCRAEVAGNDARVAGLDDHAAAARRDQPCGRAHAGTHAALGRRRRDVASLPQRTGTIFPACRNTRAAWRSARARRASRMRPSLGSNSSWAMLRTSRQRDGETRWRCALRIQDGVKNRADFKCGFRLLTLWTFYRRHQQCRILGF